MPTFTLPDYIDIVPASTESLGATFRVDLTKCDDSMITRGLYHGLHQKYTDKGAITKDKDGNPATPEYKLEQQTKLHARIYDWMRSAIGTHTARLTPAEEYRLDCVIDHMTHRMKMRGSAIKAELKGLNGTEAQQVLKGKLSTKDYKALVAKIDSNVASRLAFIGMADEVIAEAAE
jgi:hypothetical protein